MTAIDSRQRNPVPSEDTPSDSEPGSSKGKGNGTSLLNGQSREATFSNLSQARIRDILGAPITFEFSGRTASNRFLKAPMTEQLCTWNKGGEALSVRGFPTPEYVHLYERWGQGEIGIIITGNFMITHDAVENYGNAMLIDDHDGRVAEFRKITEAAHKGGSLILAQLNHPGRQGNAALNPNPVSASDVQLMSGWGGGYRKPRPLTIPEIKELEEQFANAANMAYQAGFDGIQLHAAHGYLLAQFLSPTTNLRTDEYGGSLNNRSRIVFETIDAIRRRVTDSSFIISIKVNSVEFQAKGTTPEMAKELCVNLEKAHIDFVDLSGGTYETGAFEHKKESTRAREAYFIEFAEMIRPLLSKTKVYVTGGMRTADGMANAVSSGACDGVGLGRPLAQEPFFCRHVLSGKYSGSFKNLVPTPLDTQCSGTNIHQIGQGHRILSDFSVKEEIDRWLAAYTALHEHKNNILPRVEEGGYPSPFIAQAGYAYLDDF